MTVICHSRPEESMHLRGVSALSPRPPALSLGWWWVRRLVAESADPPRSVWSRMTQSVWSRGRNSFAASPRLSGPTPATVSFALAPLEICRSNARLQLRSSYSYTCSGFDKILVPTLLCWLSAGPCFEACWAWLCRCFYFVHWAGSKSSLTTLSW